MARTISEIKQAMTAQFVADQNIRNAYDLNPELTFEQQFSRASIESIWFYIIASAHWLIETLFDTHANEVDEKIRNQRPHTLGWYRTTALNFQYGEEFNPQFFPDITEYDNTGFTEDEIDAMRIIRKCSVSPANTDKPTLIAKAHKADGKLSDDEKTAFEAYMAAKADAGVNLSIVSENADRLVIYATIRRDAMALDENGNRFTDGLNTAKETVENHLNNLQFNGVFYPSMLEQDLMRQTGIHVATITSTLAGVDGQEPAGFIDKYMPFSGAIKIDTDNDLHVIYERF